MPRRIYTYPADTGWGPLNLVASAGAVVIAVSMLLFVVNVVVSLRRGARAVEDPWGAPTLEWATRSPPPPFNFVRLPVVDSREPLWNPKAGAPAFVSGLAAEAREGLVTTVIDAVPDVRYHYPGPGIWPFVAAVALSSWLIWSIFSVKGFVWGLIPPAIAFIAWFWPRKQDNDEGLALEKAP
jgi:cytochrome c oxidase subunit 1